MQASGVSFGSTTAMPTATLKGQPLRPWTIPNAVGMLRLACIPVFLVLALRSDTGTEVLPEKALERRGLDTRGLGFLNPYGEASGARVMSPSVVTSTRTTSRSSAAAIR